MRENLRSVGQFYEEQAANFLVKHGVKILFHNFYCRNGEIDLIGLDQGTLIFIEVKYRKNNQKGLPEEAVGITKQKKICRTAMYFLYTHQKFYGYAIRYDVVAILDKHVTWYKGAFMHMR